MADLRVALLRVSTSPQVARYAEWMSMVFLLAVLMNALDCPSWRELVWSTALQFAAVGFGFSASAACQLWGPLHDGGCPWRVPPAGSSGSDSDSGSEGHWRHRGVAGPDDGTWWAPAALARSSPAHKAQLVALVLAVACFLDLFRVLKRRATRHTPSAATAASAQALLLTLWAAVTWSLFVVTHLVAAFNPPWFTSAREEVSQPALFFMYSFKNKMKKWGGGGATIM
jgi:hypothetical protein